MKYLLLLSILFLTEAAPVSFGDQTVEWSKEQLKDKVKGGWMGQVIGSLYGRQEGIWLNTTMVADRRAVAPYEGSSKNAPETTPGLYSDLYMELTFLEVFEQEGLNAPAGSFAKAYAEADYLLAHANQAGRYNILHGLRPPASGHWLNNPHADDIDFQTEADLIGLMCPGMPQAASGICDRIGHIMSHGDGYYGGLYLANLYALAYTSGNIPQIVTEATQSAPERSEFYRCMRDVIGWHARFPQDWKPAWLELQKRWGKNMTCPQSIDSVLNADAKLNAACVTLGLLYGNGDFGQTLEIIAGTGQHPALSSAAGVLGVISGYSKLPGQWKQALAGMDEQPLPYTTMSLLDACELTWKLALEVLEKNNGKTRGGQASVALQKPAPATYEKNFAGHFPTEKRWLENKIVHDQFTFEFEGIGFVLRGEIARLDSASDYTVEAELYIDNKYVEKVELPASIIKRRTELLWKYQLAHGKHRVKMMVLNPSGNHLLRVTEAVIYDVRNGF